jgi:hypothetical protein
MRTTDRPIYGEVGTILIEWLGELPSPRLTSEMTGKHYQWRVGKNPRQVDPRDLPCLARQVGRDKFRDVVKYQEKVEREKAKAEARQQEKAMAEAESSE